MISFVHVDRKERLDSEFKVSEFSPNKYIMQKVKRRQKELGNRKTYVMPQTKINKDSIIINGIEYKVGETYWIHSPLDAPYLYVWPTDKTKAKKLERDVKREADWVAYYAGKLVQIPRLKNGVLHGSQLYFEMEDVLYCGKPYIHAEQLKLVEDKVVIIKGV